MAGGAELLRRAFDFKRVKAKRWYAPILLLMAGINIAVYGLPARSRGYREAPCAASPASPVAELDCLVVPVRPGGADFDCLALQQHGQERVCGGPVSRHTEPQLDPKVRNFLTLRGIL